jgi:hypothetical protein
LGNRKGNRKEKIRAAKRKRTAKGKRTVKPKTLSQNLTAGGCHD